MVYFDKLSTGLSFAASQAESHNGESTGDIHARLAACHRDGDFHCCFCHDFRGDSEFFVAEDNQTFFGPLYIVDARNVFACFKGDYFVAVFFVVFNAFERIVPALDGNPFLAAACGTFNGYVVWPAAVAAQMNAF